MIEFLKLLIPMIVVAKTYELMLQKLAGFAFWQIWLITWILRYIPDIDKALSAVERVLLPQIAIKSWPWIVDLNPSGFGLAAMLSLLTYIFQFHDKLSDIFGIRSRFDYDNILVPLFVLSGSTTSLAKLNTIRERRDTVMRQVFYKYASSMSSTPLVDQHDIHHALNAWSWFWVALEGSVFWTIAFVASAIFGAWDIAVVCVVIALAHSAIAMMMRPSLRRRANAQIEAIASDHNARNTIRSVFDAL